MFKRILSIFIAILLLFCSSFAFATFDETFPNDNYGGSIRSSSFAMNALESLQDRLGSSFQLMSPAALLVNGSFGSLYFFSPDVSRVEPYYIYLQNDTYFKFKDGSEFSSSAADVPSVMYSCSFDLDQYANGVFDITGDWSIQIGSYTSVASLNSATVWYGNPSVNLYDSSGNLLEWPFTSGSSNIQYQIPLSPGNMLVIGDYQDLDLDSFTISATGLPPSGGSAQPYWFTGIRTGSPANMTDFWANNGSSSYNSTVSNAYWSKQPFSTSLDGVTTKGIISYSPSDFTNDFFYVYNPIGVTTSSGNVYNPTVYITFTGSLPESLYIYPAYLQDGVSSFPRYTYDGMYDPDYRPVVQVHFDDNRNLYYTNISGDTVSTSIANVPGGYNSFYETTTDPSNSVQSSVDGILNILQSGSSSVESLTNGSQSFFQTLKGMFAWLPDEVLAILVAALILVFTIGVIKVLL